MVGSRPDPLLTALTTDVLAWHVGEVTLEVLGVRLAGHLKAAEDRGAAEHLQLVHQVQERARGRRVPTWGQLSAVDRAGWLRHLADHRTRLLVQLRRPRAGAR